jgi:hypothetical protein
MLNAMLTACHANCRRYLVIAMKKEEGKSALKMKCCGK